MNLKNYISVRQASDKYYYSLRSIRYLIKNHRIKAIKHARKWWIDEPSLIQLINND